MRLHGGNQQRLQETSVLEGEGCGFPSRSPLFCDWTFSVRHKQHWQCRKQPEFRATGVAVTEVRKPQQGIFTYDYYWLQQTKKIIFKTRAIV